MAASYVTLSGTSIEVFTGDNYERWSLLMKNYLIGEGLWDHIIDRKIENEDGRRIRDDLTESEMEDWRRRNAKALYAIQLSCGPKYFEKIREIKHAGSAWIELSMSAGCSASGVGDDDKGICINEIGRLVEKSDWHTINNFIRQDSGFAGVFDSSCKTVLHNAVIAGHEQIVEILVNLERDEFLEMRDKDGYTALDLVAQLNGNTKMAKCMVEKNENLLTMKTKDDEIPLVLASARGHRELTRYLYSKTPKQVLTENNSSCGSKLFFNCITAQIFDVVLELLQDVPEISFALCNSDYGKCDTSPLLLAIANMPNIFLSGCRLYWWQRIIYRFLRPYPKPQAAGQEITTSAGQWFAQVQTVIQDSILLKVSGIKKLYDKKSVHCMVLQILYHLRNRVSDFNENQLRDASAYDAMLQAAKYGIVEFIESMAEVKPDLLRAIDKEGRGVLSHAILNRHEELFKFLLERPEQQMGMIITRRDIYGNNILHQAAELGPSSDLDSRSGAALQMQREIQWFQEVEKIAHPACKEARNAWGRKPHEVFTESHKDLIEAGEKWAKKSAQSFTIVSTLIITITFAAVFTVPGGSDQETGIPIFLKRKLFKVFMMADAVSLITASSSVLLSIIILTSGVAQQDFIMTLPTMLLTVRFLMDISVVTMMVAFCAAIAMMLNEYPNMIAAVISLAGLLAIVFGEREWPLFFLIARSTKGLKGFSSILWFPIDVFIFILFNFVTMFVFLIKKIKGCWNFCYGVFAVGAEFLCG